MSNSYHVAIVGATGVVGRELALILEEREFPIKTLTLLASSRSLGQSQDFRGESIPVTELTESSFKDVDFALFSAGGHISETYVPHAVKSGAICIDNTSFYRMDPNVPLVVPEVNESALDSHQGIIANPNCSTAQLVLALKPLHDAATIERVVISTYQSVSGAGKEALAQLETQTRLMLSGMPPEETEFPIAFNVIPQIDVFTENGYTKEEMKMIQETKKILEDDAIQVTATCVRVPVFIGHSESVNIQTKTKLSVPEIRQLLDAMPGVSVMDDTQNRVYPMPKPLAGKDHTFVGRIREDVSQENSFELFIVSDNLRKGAALNAVQIAESLAKR